MKVQVTINNVKIIEPSILNENEYNIHECEFEFVEEYNGLSKKAIFTNEAGADYIVSIVDDKCSIPSEVLKEKEFVKLGVYAYDVENEELVLRYSPKPTEFYVQEGSYKNAGGTPPTPSEIEQLQAQITHNRNDIEEIQDNINDIVEQQAIQDETIQNNTNAIGIINETIGTINENIGDLQEEQVEQNRNIQANADDIEDIQQEQITQNTNIQKNTDDIVNINQAIDTINTDITDIDSAIGNINEDIDNLEQDLTNYSLITETGSQINLNVNSTNYKITAVLKDKNGNVIYTSNAIDLPIESMIVNARYDNTTKEIVLTLQNGDTLRISVADLVSGLVSETQLQTILANYYTKTEVDNLLSAKANQSSLDATNQNLSNLAGRVSTNETDIAGIKEEQTTQNTNIEELQSQVETLQEDLESANAEIEELNTDITNMAKAMYKVDGQGSDITLENTSENKFVEFELSGRTEQESLSGKNLLPNNITNATINGVVITKNNDGTILLNGTSTDDIYDTFMTGLELEAGTYILSGNNSNNYWIRLTDNDGNVYDNLTNPITFTISITKTFSAMLRIRNGITINNVIIKPQIEQGSTATSYEPYCGGIPAPNPIYKMPIKNVTGNANAKIQNKNLFDGEIELGSINPANGELQPNTARTRSKNFIKVKPNTTYTMSIEKGLYRWVIGYTINKVGITDGNISGQASALASFSPNYSPNSFTTSTTTEYIKWYDTNSKDLTEKVQIEQGSTATSYVEHQEQNYPFTFAEGQRGMQGTQPKDDGIHQKRKHYTITGNESWSYYAFTTASQYFVGVYRIKDIKFNANILCNRLLKNNSTVSDQTGEAIASLADGYIYICLKKSTINATTESSMAECVELFKQYLNNLYINNTPYEIEYDLLEEEKIPYNENQQAQYNNIKANASSYDDITIISSESDELGFDMNVVAVADANKVIENQNNEIDTIKSRLDLLEG